MPIEVDPGGTVTITGDEIRGVYRPLVLYHGLKLEITGLKGGVLRSCYSVIKEEYHLHGSKERVLRQFEVILRQQGILNS